MSSVDDRLVKMTFDNEQFEKRVGTTLGTLEKLKQSLNFSGAAKGLEQIQSDVNGVTFDRIAEGIDALRDRFSVLGEFVNSTFSRMLEAAVNLGSGIKDALTIDAIKDGFKEYELQMGSVQTIMSSTGADVDTVNRYLKELNEYADKTIYSFSDMTANIGKFTNAGVSLDNAVNAIQGVSNVAAVSGANTNEASRAMYNFAQALSAGAVKLIDWKSIENANMATVEFKNQLIQTALAMGTLVEENGMYISTTTDAAGNVSEAFNATTMFNDSLSSQWMTTDVLVQTLGQYATDVRDLSEAEQAEYRSKLMSIYGNEAVVDSIIELGKKAADNAKDVKTFSQLVDTLKEALGSGWTQSWQYIIGDLEDAKKLWTEVSDIAGKYINESADKRNALLAGWAEQGGRTAIIDGLRNSFEALTSAMQPLKEAFDQAFPAVTVDKLVELSNNFRNLTESIKPVQSDIERLRDLATPAFDALRNSLDSLKNIGEAAFSVLKSIFDGIAGAIQPSDIQHIEDFTAKFEALTERLKPSSETLTQLSRLVKGVTSVFKALGTIVLDVASAIINAVTNMFDRIAPDGENLMMMLGNFGSSLTNFANNLQSTFNFDTFSGGFKSITDAIVNLFQTIRDGTDIPGILRKITDFIFGVDLSGITGTFNGIAEGASSVTDILHNLVKSIGNFFAGEDGLFSRIVNGIKSFVENINWDAVFNVFSHIESFVATKALLKLADFTKDFPDKIAELIKTFKSTPVENITGVLDGIKDSLSAWQNNLKAMVLIEIAVALVEIAKAVKTVSEVPPDRILSSLKALGGGLIEVVAATKFLKKSQIGDLADLWGISQIIEKLGGALKNIGEIQPERLMPSVKAMGALLLELSAALRIISGSNFNAGETKEVAIMLAAVSLSIESLGRSLERLSKIPFDQMITGLIAVGGLLAELTIAVNNMPVDKTVSGAGSMILMAIAIRLIAGAVEQLGGIDFGTMLQGLAGVGVLLAEMTIALNNFPKSEKVMQSATSMILMAVAVKMLAGAVEKLGSMDLFGMIQGLAGVGVLIAEMTIALNNMPDSGNLMASSVAMIAMAVAIGMLSDSVAKLAALDFLSMIQGLTGVGVLLGEMVTALNFMPDSGKLMSSSVAMIAMSVAIGMLSDTVAKLGALDLGTLAKGLGAIAVSLTAFVAALRLMPDKGAIGSSVAIIGMAVAINILAGPLERLGKLSLGELVIGLAALAGSLVVLGVAADKFSNIRGLAEGVLAMMGMAVAVALLAPGLALLANIEIGGLLIALGALAGTFVIFAVAANALAPTTGVILAFAAAVALTGIGLFALAAAIGAIADIVVNSSTNLSESFGVFLQALIDNVPKLGELAATAINTLLQVIQDVMPEIGETIVAFVTTLIKSVVDIISTSGPDIINAVVEFITRLLESLAEHAPRLGEAAKTLINTAIDVLANVIATSGPTVIDALIEFLTRMLESLAEHAPRMAEAALSFIQSFLQSIADHIQEIVQAGIDIVLNFLRGVTERMDDIVDTAFKMVIGFIEGLAKAIDENHNALFEAVGHLITSIVNAIIDGISMIASAAGKWLTGEDGNGGILGAIGGFFTDIFNAGANLVQGFIDGLTSMPGKLWDAACGLANDAWNAITGTLDEHSPSRLTFGGGSNFTLGFINGMISLKKRVAEESAGVALAAMSSFDENIDSSAIYTPTITPVIDSTEIQNGITSLNGMLYNVPDTYGITANLESNNRMRKQIVDVMGTTNDYSGIIGSINNLRDEMSMYNESLKNLQIVMDSGQLVGAITPGMDQALGQRQNLALRGVF